VRVGFVGGQIGITTADQRYGGYQSALRAGVWRSIAHPSRGA